MQAQEIEELLSQLKHEMPDGTEQRIRNQDCVPVKHQSTITLSSPSKSQQQARILNQSPSQPIFVSPQQAYQFYQPQPRYDQNSSRSAMDFIVMDPKSAQRSNQMERRLSNIEMKVKAYTAIKESQQASREFSKQQLNDKFEEAFSLIRSNRDQLEALRKDTFIVSEGVERHLAVQAIYQEDLDYYSAKTKIIVNGLDMLKEKVVATRDRQPDKVEKLTQNLQKRAASPRAKNRQQTKAGLGSGNKTLTATSSNSSTRRKWL